MKNVSITPDTVFAAPLDVDAMLQRMIDNRDPVELAEAAPARGHRLTEGERRLMVELLTQALRDSVDADRVMQCAARAWLRMQPGFSAQECCDTLGIHYDAMMKELEDAWKRAPRRYRKITRRVTGGTRHKVGAA